MLACSIVGAGLPATAAPRFFRQTELQASQASQLPQVHSCSQHLMLARSTVGAGLPAMAAPRFFRQTKLQASQASQLPPVMGASAIWGHHCGSGLARDGIGAKYLTDRAVCIAGKPAPTGHGVLRYLGTSLWERACSRWHRREIPDRPRRKHRRQASSYRSWGAPLFGDIIVGAGLLAMASA